MLEQVAIDLDTTLVTARSDKEGAKGNFKTGIGYHPLGAWPDFRRSRAHEGPEKAPDLPERGQGRSGSCYYSEPNGGVAAVSRWRR